jgi:hypothetical protein
LLLNIHKIDVSSNNISGKGCEAISTQNIIIKLQRLDLRNNKIGNIGFEALIKSKLFPNLIDLRLDMNKIDDTKQLAYSCSLDKI